MHPYVYRSLNIVICISLLLANPWFWTQAQNQRPRREGRPRPVEPAGLHGEYAYANTVLNELMHQARNSGTFSDRALAIAAFSLLSSDDKLKHPLPTTNDIEVNSRYFHRLFKLHCRSITGE